MRRSGLFAFMALSSRERSSSTDNLLEFMDLSLEDALCRNNFLEKLFMEKLCLLNEFLLNARTATTFCASLRKVASALGRLPASVCVVLKKLSFFDSIIIIVS
eukprot:CAMPEP_0173213224 /NCGR_PEP_ID=MMETSP1141-20130122/25262_1 /TAXON_ID=483371 /ORGANISM="non described non described, Strain CCMP2298" /LENGTH=102 /DNA_ID=CAMNT_0014140381 /DNA_START=236 /DNA_END=544 /DNA_ORIENTATION=-